MTMCGSCSGSGQVTCPGCGGRGSITRMTGTADLEINSCVVCGGSRRVRCGFCAGGGQVSAAGRTEQFPVATLARANKTNSLAIASLVLGIVAWLGLSFVASIPAVIAGHAAKRQIKAANGEIRGDGVATFGLVIGYASIVGSILFFGIFSGMFDTFLGN